MSQTIVPGYSARSLTYDASVNAFALVAGYDPAETGIRILFGAKDDGFGQPTPLTVTVTDGRGMVLSSGVPKDSPLTAIALPDGSSAYLERIEIGGKHLGYVSSETLPAGGKFPVIALDDIIEANDLGCDVIETMSGFGPGTMITTIDGQLPVEWLRAGDRILARDRGFQPLVWTGLSRISTPDRAERPDLNPVFVEMDSLGENKPERTLCLSRRHHLLMSS